MNKPGRKPRPILEKFMEKVDRNHPSGCWQWTGSKDSWGYGQIRIVSSSGGSKIRGAHRISFELFKGEIPDGYFVCHTCDNPRCVNPDHLFLGTQTDNMQDRLRKGRNPFANKTHCKNGHEFTEENTIHYKSGRSCRTCSKVTKLKYYYKIKEKSKALEQHTS